jgi:GrpB-like predicted nucleotidyltransferase (UPF0157 family)
MDSTEEAEIEQRLRQATIGEPVVLNGTILLAPYDPAWPQHYHRLETRIREALGTRAVLVEHVGSTSVPALSAKPIIDVVMAVGDSADERAYVPALEQAGFVLKIREPDWFEHRMLKAFDPEANIHVFSRGCDEIGRMLAFRDRLRSHDGDRILYETTKRELAARTWKHVQNYADAKSEVVREILSRMPARTA